MKKYINKKHIKYYIKNNYNNVSDKGIAEVFCVSTGLVQKMRQRMGLVKCRAVVVALQKKANAGKYDILRNYIKDNYLTSSDRDIADYFCKDINIIAGTRRRMGISRSVDNSNALRDKVRGNKQITEPCFDSFWNG